MIQGFPSLTKISRRTLHICTLCGIAGQHDFRQWRKIGR
jgi:hypothetical protein